MERQGNLIFSDYERVITTMEEKYGDISVKFRGDYVIEVEIKRAPNNFFDQDLIRDLADCFIDADKSSRVRAIVLCSDGKHFCAGNNFNSSTANADREIGTRNPLYVEAVRLFHCQKPVIAAVQGAAIGGGLGLAVMADFRVVCSSTRMAANFVKLGFTPGFGLTHTLPRLIGKQKANFLFLTGRRIDGKTAHDWGLGDIFTENKKVRLTALDLAAEIAENAPLAVVSLRNQLRSGLAEAVQRATDIEGNAQQTLQRTKDHQEGIRAVAERRKGNFDGT